MKLFLLVLSIIVSVFCEDLIITLPNGKIRGFPITPPATVNVTYYGYLGIPFAAPPVGKLRFKPPQPVENWKGILEANNSKVSCYQVGRDEEYETEDCLYLNVYTPLKPSSSEKLPVLVFIYGGTFVHGHANYNYNSPAFLLRDNILLVTFNYRVGPFGFLSTGDTIIPGNMGLKDQQFVLKWVNKNIHIFGGDPNKVTIMGQSAGAASVTYQLLSPGSAGLFRAAIACSGTALCTWAQQRNAVNTAYGIATEINPNFERSRSTQELLDFLITVKASIIDSTSNKYSVFAPVIEVPHDGAFISNNMYNTAKNGTYKKVPILMGINSEESIAMARDLQSWKKHVEGYDKDPATLVDNDMYITNEDKKVLVGKQIKNIYVNQDLFANNLGKGVQYYGDNRFTRAIIKFAELISEHVNTYFYQFSYHGELGGNNVSLPDIGQVAHAEDQRYLWTEHDSYDQYPKSDVLTLNRYVKFITNFVKYLNPVHDLKMAWPVMKPDSMKFLDINYILKIQENPRNFSYFKWVDIFEKYVNQPFISY